MDTTRHATTPPLALAALGALAAASLLVGCSSDDPYGSGDDDPTTTSEADADSDADAPPVSLDIEVNDEGTEDVTAAGAAASVEMEMDDSYFGPTFVVAEPGATLTVALENEGTKTHTFSIDQQSIAQTVDAGQAAEVTVTVPDDGFVEFYCEIHESDGMAGAVIAGSA